PAEDGKAVLVPIPLDAELASELIGGEEGATALVSTVRDAAPDALSEADLTSWVTGPAASIADLTSAFAGIDGILLLVALVVVLIILTVVYRSPLLPIAVIVTAVFALCLAALVIVPLARGDVLVLNGQSQGFLSILVMGAATDYSLLLVARYREAPHRYDHPSAAMRTAWRATLERIAASAGTVIVGVLCLLLSDLRSNSSLGPVAAIGIASALLGALTFLPAVLLLGGRRSRLMFWPSRPAVDGQLGRDQHGQDEQARGGHHGQEDEQARDGHHRRHGQHARRSQGLWQRVATFVTGNARRVWVTTAVVLAVFAGLATILQASGTSNNAVFLNETESVAGQDVLADHFDVGTVEPAHVVTTPANAEQVREAAAD